MQSNNLENILIISLDVTNDGDPDWQGVDPLEVDKRVFHLQSRAEVLYAHPGKRVFPIQLVPICGSNTLMQYPLSQKIKDEIKKFSGVSQKIDQLELISTFATSDSHPDGLLSNAFHFEAFIQLINDLWEEGVRPEKITINIGEISDAQLQMLQQSLLILPKPESVSFWSPDEPALDSTFLPLVDVLRLQGTRVLASENAEQSSDANGEIDLSEWLPVSIFNNRLDKILDWKEATGQNAAANSLRVCLTSEWDGKIELDDYDIENIPRDLLMSLENGLMKLYLENNPRLLSVDGLERCKILRVLFINDTGVKALDLTDFNLLESLNASNNKDLNIRGLETCSALIYLTLRNNNLSRFDIPDSLQKLLDLDLSYNYSLSEITGLEKLSFLEYLDLSVTKLSKFSAQGLASLEELRINGSYDLVEITHLQDAKNLKILDVENDEELVALNISQLKLKKLIANYTQKLTRIEGLEEQSELEVLELTGSGLESVDITNMSKLKKLNVSKDVNLIIHGFRNTPNGLVRDEDHFATFDSAEVATIYGILRKHVHGNEDFLPTLHEILLASVEKSFEDIIRDAKELGESIDQPSEAIEKKANSIIRSFLAISLGSEELSADYAQQIIECLPKIARYLNESDIALCGLILEKTIKQAPEAFQKSIEVPGRLFQTWYKGRTGDRNISPADYVTTAKFMALHNTESQDEYQVISSVVFTDDVNATSAVLEKLKVKRNHFLALLAKEFSPPNLHRSDSFDLRNEESWYQNHKLNEAAIQEYQWLIDVLSNELRAPREMWQDILNQLDNITIIDRKILYDPDQPHWKKAIDAGFPKEKIDWLASAAERELSGLYKGQTAASNIDRIVMMLMGGMYRDLDIKAFARLPKLYAPFGGTFVMENQMMASHENQKTDSIFFKFLEQIADDYNPSNDVDASIVALANEEQQEEFSAIHERSNKGFLRFFFDKDVPNPRVYNQLETPLELQTVRNAYFHISEYAKRMGISLVMSDLRATKSEFRYHFNNRITANIALLHHVVNNWGAPLVHEIHQGEQNPVFALGVLARKGYFDLPRLLNWRRVNLTKQQQPRRASDSIIVTQRKQPQYRLTTHQEEALVGTVGLLYLQQQELQQLTNLQSIRYNGDPLAKVQNEIWARIDLVKEILPEHDRELEFPITRVDDITKLQTFLDEERKYQPSRMRRIQALKSQVNRLQLRALKENFVQLMREYQSVKLELLSERETNHYSTSEEVNYYEKQLKRRAQAQGISVPQLIKIITEGSALPQVNILHLDSEDRASSNKTSSFEESNISSDGVLTPITGSERIDELSRQLIKIRSELDIIRKQLADAKLANASLDEDYRRTYENLLKPRAEAHGLTVNELMSRIGKGSGLTSVKKQALKPKSNISIESLLDDYSLPKTLIGIRAFQIERALKKALGEKAAVLPPIKKLGDVDSQIEIPVRPLYRVNNITYTLLQIRDHATDKFIILALTPEDRAKGKIKVTDAQLKDEIKRNQADADRKVMIPLRVYPPSINKSETREPFQKKSKAPFLK